MRSKERGLKHKRKPSKARGVGLAKVLRRSPLTLFWGERKSFSNCSGLIEMEPAVRISTDGQHLAPRYLHTTITYASEICFFIVDLCGPSACVFCSLFTPDLHLPLFHLPWYCYDYRNLFPRSPSLMRRIKCRF